jgi:hypothetical protein
MKTKANTFLQLLIGIAIIVLFIWSDVLTKRALIHYYDSKDVYLNLSTSECSGDYELGKLATISEGNASTIFQDLTSFRFFALCIAIGYWMIFIIDLIVARKLRKFKNQGNM